jgi:hypothetical protein
VAWALSAAFECFCTGRAIYDWPPAGDAGAQNGPESTPWLEEVVRQVSWEALLSGALGGALLMLVQIAYGQWDARRKRAKELEGLLTLLYFEEVVPNTKLAETLLENRSSLVAEKITLTRSFLKTALWETSRNRVSELTDDGLLIGLISVFYMSVERFKFSLDLDPPPDPRQENGLQSATNMKATGDALIQYLNKIIVKPER